MKVLTQICECFLPETSGELHSMDDAVTWALQSVQKKHLMELKLELALANNYNDQQLLGLLDLWNGSDARYRFVEATSIRELLDGIQKRLDD